MGRKIASKDTAKKNVPCHLLQFCHNAKGEVGEKLDSKDRKTIFFIWAWGLGEGHVRRRLVSLGQVLVLIQVVLNRLSTNHPGDDDHVEERLENGSKDPPPDASHPDGHDQTHNQEDEALDQRGKHQDAKDEVGPEITEEIGNDFFCRKKSWENWSSFFGRN